MRDSVRDSMRIIRRPLGTLLLSIVPAIVAPDIGRAEEAGHAGKRPAESVAARVVSGMAAGHARNRHHEPQPHGRPPINAVGLPAGAGPTPGPRDAAGRIQVVPAAPPAAAVRRVMPPPSPLHRATGLNGTGVIHPGSGPATIGGAGSRSTGVNGTQLQKKR